MAIPPIDAALCKRDTVRVIRYNGSDLDRVGLGRSRSEPSRLDRDSTKPLGPCQCPIGAALCRIMRVCYDGHNAVIAARFDLGTIIAIGTIIATISYHTKKPDPLGSGLD